MESQPVPEQSNVVILDHCYCANNSGNTQNPIAERKTVFDSGVVNAAAQDRAVVFSDSKQMDKYAPFFIYVILFLYLYYSFSKF